MKKKIFEVGKTLRYQGAQFERLSLKQDPSKLAARINRTNREVTNNTKIRVVQLTKEIKKYYEVKFYVFTALS